MPTPFSDSYVTLVEIIDGVRVDFVDIGVDQHMDGLSTLFEDSETRLFTEDSLTRP